MSEDERLEEAKEWGAKAYNDLRSARLLIRSEVPVCDTGCFHCQQAIEKLLKAYLTAAGIQVGRVHSLVYLVNQCVGVDPRFHELYELVEPLVSYAVDVRYPGESDEVSPEEASVALEKAEEAWKMIRHCFPEGVRGGIPE